MTPAKKGSRFWRGIGPDGVVRQTQVHSRRDGRTVASGTATAIARQLGFESVKEMYEYLQKL